MTRFMLVLQLLVLVLGDTLTQTKQGSKPEDDLIQQLLNFPAPPPQNDASQPEPKPARFTQDAIPPDDAPLDILGLYWENVDDSKINSASPKTRERLLEDCVQNPKFATSLLNILPQTADALDVV